ncbi:hypothetical protein N7452_004115 [Penicillium brevicompactum]|uniref:Uncharacterized protein n=1 Tax=Penicillium brevicompactum TaxID=5074 RepID=A0A9W9QUV2_PENBR|nr:hypothetical protein N7452_004115 [Penicillium brevicompactum]
MLRNTMADRELKIALEQVVNMAKFSHLLEMDDEEGRISSSSAIYGFIDAGEHTSLCMEEAL